MREQLGITLDADEIWASSESASKVILPNIEEGYSADYNVNKYPDRRHLNYTLAQLTAVGFDVNRFGCGMPWDDSITYEQYAWVTGSDGNLYRSETADNINFDPLAAGGINVPSRWRELGELLGIPYLKIDTEYLPIADGGHTKGIYHVGAGTWVYDIDLFVGIGVVPADIRSVWIKSTGSGTGGDYVTATYGGVAQVICGHDGGSSGDSHIPQSLVQVPVDPNGSVTIVQTGGGSFKIIGVTQVKMI